MKTINDSSICNLKKFGDISTFYLLLGAECNMNCRHCLQKPMRNEKFSLNEINKEVKVLLDNYIEYAKEHKYLDGRPNYVCFWGGEPLLHWDFIRKTIVEVFDKHNLYNNTNVRFVLTTNGLLLDQNKVDFINKYGLRILFSYDAPHPFAVRDYVSDDICNLVKKINCYGILCSGNAINCDPLLAFKCLKRKFPNAKRYGVGLEFVSTFNVPSDIVNYDFNKIADNLRKMRICIQLNKNHDEMAFSHTFYWQVISSIFYPQRNKFKDTLLPVWNMGSEILATTLDGKIPVHPNDCTVWIGNVYDTLSDINQRCLDFYRLKQDPRCKTCEHLDVCLGCCAIAMRDKDNHIVDCSLFFLKYYTLLKNEALKLSDVLTENDILWYKKEEEKMNLAVEQFLLEDVNYKKGGDFYVKRRNE